MPISEAEWGGSPERSILPDGGYADRPTYFRCVGRDAGLGVCCYCRATGQSMAAQGPDPMWRGARFAKALISTEAASDMVPICDAGPRHEVLSQALMASLLPNSAWTRMLRKTVGRHRGWPVSQTPPGADPAALADAAIAWGLIARSATAPESMPPAVTRLPAMGPLVWQRRLGCTWVKLFIQGNHAGAGHTHEDKGRLRPRVGSPVRRHGADSRRGPGPGRRLGRWPWAH